MTARSTRRWAGCGYPTAFAAGFAHEAQGLGDQLRIRSLIEDRLAREVVISAACGLGRRSPEAGRAVLERHAELCG